MRALIIIILLNYFFLVVQTAVVINSGKGEGFEVIQPTPSEKLLKEDKKFWFNQGKEMLVKNLKRSQEYSGYVAKNVVIFIGDGMGIATITATRIYKGQREFGKSGEDHNLVYDEFPNVGLVKTYNVDKQVPDSAGTATALFTGVKANYEAIGVDATCNATVLDRKIFDECKLESIMTWAQNANKDTGIITTTRITHATPAATYAHVNHRSWECDSEIPENARMDFKDIARQLIEDAPGRNFKVILGGGFQQFGHISQNQTTECMRNDNRNLTRQWIETHKYDKAKYVTNTEELNQINTKETDYLFGLFDANHLPYELIRDKSPKGSPSLTEMTRKGLEILKKSSNGYVLMVEGGRIDHAHHKNYARLAMEESSEFDRAIELVVKETGEDTLILVTADHSHAFTLNGYAQRGNDILGHGVLEKDKKPGLTLTYANGPGFNYHYQANATNILGPWIDPRTDSNRFFDPKYRHMATYYLKDETHAGEDVAIFAKGPNSELIRGVMEQNYVAHLVSFSACIGPEADINIYCSRTTEGPLTGHGHALLAKANSNYNAHILCFILVNVFYLFYVL